MSEISHFFAYSRIFHDLAFLGISVMAFFRHLNKTTNFQEQQSIKQQERTPFNFFFRYVFLASSNSIYWDKKSTLQKRISLNIIVNSHLSSQPTPNVPGTLPKSHLMILTSGTTGDFKRTNEKNDNLTIKLHFGSNSPYTTYLFL